jgi:hypothetical protein
MSKILIWHVLGNSLQNDRTIIIIIIIIMPYNPSTAHVDSGNSSGTSNNRSNWNYLRIFQEMPEQHTGKAECQATK